MSDRFKAAIGVAFVLSVVCGIAGHHNDAVQFITAGVGAAGAFFLYPRLPE